MARCTVCGEDAREILVKQKHKCIKRALFPRFAAIVCFHLLFTMVLLYTSSVFLDVAQIYLYDFNNCHQNQPLFIYVIAYRKRRWRANEINQAAARNK